MYLQKFSYQKNSLSDEDFVKLKAVKEEERVSILEQERIELNFADRFDLVVCPDLETRTKF